MMKTTKNKKIDIEEYFDDILPNVGCELNYSKDYELLIAVMLSAQTTDVSVNNVTKILFSKYNTLKDLDNADISDIERIIKPIGLYKNKAQNIKKITNALLSYFNGTVPSDIKLLTSMPGVGNKTACVVRAEAFKIPEFPVDTHVLRISKRLMISNEDDKAIDAERKLKIFFDKDNWIKLHHQFIHFGRTICAARNPNCNKCRITNYCKYYSSLNKESKASK